VPRPTPRGDQATLTSASVSAPMAPSFLPRRLCGPTCRAHRARGGWKHSRRCPRDTRPPEPLHCPVDIRPVDIFAQRQHVWIARPTLKAIDQEQSLATVHHAIAGSGGSIASGSSIRRLRDSQSGVVDLLAEIFNLVVRPRGHDADPGLLRAFPRAAGGRGFTCCGPGADGFGAAGATG
jgi:hypothetical protein